MKFKFRPYGCVALLVSIIWNSACVATDKATGAHAQCGGLCEVCVALISSSDHEHPTIAFRDSLNSDSGPSAACGAFDNKLMSEGWGYLRVRTNEKVSDIDQAWTAGFVEG